VNPNHRPSYNDNDTNDEATNTTLIMIDLAEVHPKCERFSYYHDSEYTRCNLPLRGTRRRCPFTVSRISPKQNKKSERYSYYHGAYYIYTSIHLYIYIYICYLSEVLDGGADFAHDEELLECQHQALARL